MRSGARQDGPTARPSDAVVANVRVVYRFGNHCDKPARVDFAAPVVRVLLADGRRLTLSTAGGARRSAVIDAYASGAESVGYYDPSVFTDALSSVVALCVDASRLEAGVEGAERPVCFRARGRTFFSVDATNVDDAASPALPLGRVASLVAVRTVDSDTGATCSVSDDGVRWCNKFGEWERKAPVTFGLGVSTHRFDLAQRAVFADEGFGQPGTISGAPLGGIQAVSLDLSSTWVFHWPFYVGFDLQVGGAATDHAPILSSTPYLAVTGAGVMLGGGITAGLESPRLGPLAARLEMYAGGVSVDLWPDSASINEAGGCTADGCPGVTYADWVLEPRARVSAWVSPWWTVDGWGGLGLMPFGNWSAGVAVTLHLRSFDGSP